MLAAVIGAFSVSTGPHAAIDDIARRFNAAATEELGRSMSNKWVGGFVRRRLRLATTKTNGVFVVPRGELKRAEALAVRFGAREAA